jgi:hypothetical protein
MTNTRTVTLLSMEHQFAGDVDSYRKRERGKKRKEE